MRYGVATLIVGALVMAFGSDLFAVVSRVSAGNAEVVGPKLASLVLSFVNNAFMPLGGALVAAGIVINTLAPAIDTADREPPA